MTRESGRTGSCADMPWATAPADDPESNGSLRGLDTLGAHAHPITIGGVES